MSGPRCHSSESTRCTLAFCHDGPCRFEPRITPAMVKRLKSALRREWLVLRGIQREAWPIFDTWAARENKRTK